MVRDVRGDGSCGYRAVLFGALERNWERTVDHLPIATLPWLPRRRPMHLANFWAQHDGPLCRVARDVAATGIRASNDDLAWAGDPNDAGTEAGRSLADAMHPTGWMDEVAMHALAARLGVRIAILYDDGTTLHVPLFDNGSPQPSVAVCLLPGNAARPTENAGHYMLAYPGRINDRGHVHLDASCRTTTINARTDTTDVT